MQTMHAFCEQNGITADVDAAASNPNMADDAWASTAQHYLVTLHRGDAELPVPFSAGSAASTPTAEDVLSCLALDANSVDGGQTFDDWCADFGYDTDSRRAERGYQACIALRAQLIDFLGESLVEALLTKVEPV